MVWRAGRVAALVGLAACLVTTSVVFTRLTPGMQSRQAAHRFLDNLRAAAPQWTSASVVPLRVPTDVAASFLDPYGREETFLTLVDRHFTPGVLRDGSHWTILDEHAVVHDAVLRPEVTLSGTDVDRLAQPNAQLLPQGSGCYRSTSVGGGGLLLQLPRTVSSPPQISLMVELTYRAPADTSLRLASSAGASWQFAPLTLTVPHAAGTLVGSLEAESADRVGIVELAPNTAICIDALSVVQPVVRESATVCRSVDRYGVIGNRMPCEPGGSARVPGPELQAKRLSATA
jgi:hypothetical protein